MQYLVTMETVERTPGAPLSPKEFAHWMEGVVSNDAAMTKLIRDKKVLAGGVLAGRKGSAFIIEAASNNEVGQLLTLFPLYVFQKVDVTPLESFETRAAQNRQRLDALKTA